MRECFPPPQQEFCFLLNFNSFLGAISRCCSFLGVVPFSKCLFKFESFNKRFFFCLYFVLKFLLSQGIVFSTGQGFPLVVIMSGTAGLCCNEVELVDQLSMTCTSDCHFSRPSSADTALATSSCQRELLRFHAGLMPLHPGDPAAMSTLQYPQYQVFIAAINLRDIFMTLP